MSAIDTLVTELSRLPTIGRKSALRLTYHLLKQPAEQSRRLAEALVALTERVRPCGECFNLTEGDRCAICADPRRDPTMIVVVEDVGDLWALERSGATKARFHVLGGVLSALDGVGPDDLDVAGLLRRVREGGVEEVVLAMNATVEGQTTAHYVADRLAGLGCRVSRLAHGVPVGGELDYLDDGTLVAAIRSRRSL